MAGTAIRFPLFLLAAGLVAAPPPDALAADPLNRNTPQNAVVSFLNACHAHDYQKARRYINLRSLPEAVRIKEGVQLAQQLDQVLESDPSFDVAGLPSTPDGSTASVSRPELNGKPVDLSMERVTLRSGVSIWLFSADSARLIPALARQVSESPIERYLPGPLVDWKPQGVSLYRWLMPLVFAAILAGLSGLLLYLGGRILSAATVKIAPRFDRGAAGRVVAPIRFLLVMAGFGAGVAWIDASAPAHLYLKRGAGLLSAFGMAWLAAAVVDLLVGHTRELLSAKHESFAWSAMPLASKVAKVLIVLIAAATVLSSWGYNTTTILAGLGVGSLAVALAAQKTIEDLFGGVAVISDRPVRVGDFCRFGDRSGTVEDVGLRSTRVRTLDRTLVTVPNGQFSGMTLENYSRRDKMWFHFTLNLRRDTTPEQVRRLLRSIGARLATRPKIEPGAIPVRFVGLGAYSLDIEIFVYILTQDGDEFLVIQQELLLWILDEVAAAGTALAVPTQAYVALDAAQQPKAGNEPEFPRALLT
ncbi:MAG: mechanosensitive ion channel family protein [Acidobacteriota bacterium]|nr:mechanosensitive ion channel family protein [Acidobacteriota bacterium]